MPTFILLHKLILFFKIIKNNNHLLVLQRVHGQTIGSTDRLRPWDVVQLSREEKAVLQRSSTESGPSQISAEFRRKVQTVRGVKRAKEYTFFTLNWSELIGHSTNIETCRLWVITMKRIAGGRTFTIYLVYYVSFTVKSELLRSFHNICSIYIYTVLANYVIRTTFETYINIT